MYYMSTSGSCCAAAAAALDGKWFLLPGTTIPAREWHPPSLFSRTYIDHHRSYSSIINICVGGLQDSILTLQNHNPSCLSANTVFWRIETIFWKSSGVCGKEHLHTVWTQLSVNLFFCNHKINCFCNNFITSYKISSSSSWFFLMLQPSIRRVLEHTEKTEKHVAM